MNYKVWWAAGSCVALALSIVATSFFVGSSSDFALNLTSIVIGFATGWLLGISMSPYTAKEQARFSKYAACLASSFPVIAVEL